MSLDPTLILWSIDKRVSTYDIFTKTDRFAVHILANDQGELAGLFATRGVDRFGQSEWQWSDHQLPILAGAAGVLQCRTYKTVEAGDHMILIGQVIAIDDYDKEPLLYHKRNFGAIPESFYQK